VRSYGIYLWHWPVFLVIGQDLPVAPGGGAYLLTRVWCVVVTFVIADLSYRFVETPVRRHGFAGSARVATARLRRWGTRSARIVWSVVLVLVVALVAVLLTAPDRTSTEELISANEAELVDAAPSPAASTPATSKVAPAAVPAVWAMPKGTEIDAFGDSMMVGAIHALRYYMPKIRVDAKSNRKWREAPALVAARGDTLRRAVVLAFGTNAGTDEASIRRTLAEIGPNRMVVIVTEHGRFARVKTDNAKLREIVKDMPNVRLAEWDAALAGTSGQLQPDGIHPSLKGAHLYSKTVRQAFADLSQAHTGKAVTLKPLPMP
jgi:hypothetical protein